jgi:hypothetical protein
MCPRQNDASAHASQADDSLPLAPKERAAPLELMIPMVPSLGELISLSSEGLHLLVRALVSCRRQSRVAP